MSMTGRRAGSTVEQVGINSFEEQPEAVKAAVGLGESIAAFPGGK
jgi:hypothetical protein